MGLPYLPTQNRNVNQTQEGKGKDIKTAGTIRIESLKRNGRLKEELNKTTKMGK